jgi:branched-chain amino acid transport system permease protein
VLLSGLILLVGVVMVVEMSYHLTLNFASGSKMRLFGFPIDSAAPEVWLLATGVLVAGAASFEAMRRYFAREWGAVQAEIEERMRREAGL